MRSLAYGVVFDLKVSTPVDRGPLSVPDSRTGLRFLSLPSGSRYQPRVGWGGVFYIEELVKVYVFSRRDLSECDTSVVVAVCV